MTPRFGELVIFPILFRLSHDVGQRVIMTPRFGGLETIF